MNSGHIHFEWKKKRSMNNINMVMIYTSAESESVQNCLTDNFSSQTFSEMYFRKFYNMSYL